MKTISVIVAYDSVTSWVVEAFHKRSDAQTQIDFYDIQAKLTTGYCDGDVKYYKVVKEDGSEYRVGYREMRIFETVLNPK